MPNPRHIAIIMDGNGRWAKAHRLPRIAGHKAGVDALRRIINHVADIHIKWLTIFAFSSENWKRPVDEVDHLMTLLKLFIKSDLNKLCLNNVCIKIIGSRENLPSDIIELLEHAESITADNTGLTLVVAFNYGGRDELVRAVKNIATQVLTGGLSLDFIDDATIERNLDTSTVPDPDLIIRTSGEKRLSNFLLWQSAYSEFYFSPKMWPDFNESDFDEAIEDYHLRERRYGGINKKCDDKSLE